MAPYLDTVTSFADVPITDAGVDTLAFLKASEGVVGLFDHLGSTAFGVVQSDLKGNIAKVRARYDETPTLSNTLEKLVENEKGEKKRKATEGSPLAPSRSNAQANASEELAAAFAKAYDVTLKGFHNFVVKGIFSVAMKACPYRADFFTKLKADPAGGPPASDEHVAECLNKWLIALDGIVTRLQTFYKAGGHDKGF
ncbi:het-c2 protein [Lactarius sanguifluus]|nr:het-c2 protein [Lactarius sanguifluus]